MVNFRIHPEQRPTRLTLGEFFERRGLVPLDIVEMTSYGDVPGPALCLEQCVVGLHENCEHGCPSTLLEMILYDYDL